MTIKPPQIPTVLVFMGVAGCGKSTVAALFAKKAGAVFIEGDDFHPPENVSKMRSGIPLTDADRQQWLQTLRQIILRALESKQFTALTCSALKSKYRDTLAAGDPRVVFVHLTGPRDVIAARMKNRTGHFMPPSLLDSQLKDLEPPAAAIVLSIEKSPEEIVAELLRHFEISAD